MHNSGGQWHGAISPLLEQFRHQPAVVIAAGINSRAEAFDADEIDFFQKTLIASQIQVKRLAPVTFVRLFIIQKMNLIGGKIELDAIVFEHIDPKNSHNGIARFVRERAAIEGSDAARIGEPHISEVKIRRNIDTGGAFKSEIVDGLASERFAQLRFERLVKNGEGSPGIDD